MSGETQEVLRICEQLPPAERALVAGFARSLLASHDAGASQPSQPAGNGTSRFGFAKGKIEMRDDFDEPLDEFAEYR